MAASLGALHDHLGKFLACLLSVTALAVGCISTEPTPQVESAELLIDQSAMPQNWHVSYLGAAFTDYRQREGAAIEFVANSRYNHVASHSVYLYRDEREAARGYRRILPIEFFGSSPASLSPWLPPPELPYKSSIADQYQFACYVGAITQVVTICQAVGRYDNYVIIFQTHLVSGYMTYSDIQSVLQDIDKLMADALSSS